MSRDHLVFLLVLALTVTRGAAAAESPSATQEAAGERPAVFAPVAAAPATPSPPAALARPRVVSPAVAEQLSAVAPKYEPVPAKPPEPQPDLREIDKPRNTIVRLPPYLVPEKKEPPVLKERELLTPKARLEAALRKYPGLRVGSFWIFSNDGIALFMQQEEERLEKKREFEGYAELMRLTDPQSAAALKREVDRAFLRPADFGR